MNWADFDSKRRLVATLGRFCVYYDPLVHLPWGLYRVYAGEKYIGAQISYPCESDCQWLAKQDIGRTLYAATSRTLGSRTYFSRGATSPARLACRKEKAAA
jgi:hypothetical protein